MTTDNKIQDAISEFGADIVHEVIEVVAVSDPDGAYSIFEDRVEAINYCINRFDDDTKTAFMDLWSKMNAPVSEVSTPTPEPTEIDDEVPF